MRGACLSRKRRSTTVPPLLTRVGQPPSQLGPHRKALTRICAICSREAKGFGYVHQLRFDQYPHHRFCSIGCSEAGRLIAQKANGMIDITAMEARAIKDARHRLAKVLTELGLMETFLDRTAEDIDRLIEACIDGVQESMRRQAKEGSA
jgi:hypothetical protein